jgi:hypothetical protein
LAIALPNSISMGQAIHRFADDLEVPLDRFGKRGTTIRGEGVTVEKVRYSE